MVKIFQPDKKSFIEHQKLIHTSDVCKENFFILYFILERVLATLENKKNIAL